MLRRAWSTRSGQAALFAAFTSMTALFFSVSYEANWMDDSSSPAKPIYLTPNTTVFSTPATLGNSSSETIEELPWWSDHETTNSTSDRYVVTNDADWEKFGPARESWEPTRQLDVPLTELTLQQCFMPPSIYDLCSPPETPGELAEKGPWSEVGKDIRGRISMTSTFFYYRRLQYHSEADVVTNIALSQETPAPTYETSYWTKIPLSLSQITDKSLLPFILPNKDKPNSRYVWYERTPQKDIIDARKANNATEPITEISILYGNGTHALYGWHLLDDPIAGRQDDPSSVLNGGKRERTRIMYRRARNVHAVAPEKKPKLRFSSQGTFRIVQVGDMHISTSMGRCRNVDDEHLDGCYDETADVYSIHRIFEGLRRLKPDFIVFSGDQINGQDTSWDAASAMLKWEPYLWNLSVPWTGIFGNHDADADVSLFLQYRLMQMNPHFLGTPGEYSVDGVGNFYLPVAEPGQLNSQKNQTLFSLYFLDSHANRPSLLWFAKNQEYDYLKASQASWFKSVSSLVDPILRPWTKNSPSSFSEDELYSGPEPPTKDAPVPAKPNAMVFFHIPLPEAFDDSLIDKGAFGNNFAFGDREESQGSPKFNSHFFDVALQAQRERLERPAANASTLDEFFPNEFSRPTTGRPEVKVIANGHDHLNSDCRRLHGIWSCFAGGSSFSGYGTRKGLDPVYRKLRVFDLADFGETISTFHLVDGQSGFKETNPVTLQF